MSNIDETKTKASDFPIVSTRYERAEMLDELARRRNTKRAHIIAAALDEYLGRNAAELVRAA